MRPEQIPYGRHDPRPRPGGTGEIFCGVERTTAVLSSGGDRLLFTGGGAVFCFAIGGKSAPERPGARGRADVDRAGQGKRTDHPDGGGTASLRGGGPAAAAVR